MYRFKSEIKNCFGVQAINDKLLVKRRDETRRLELYDQDLRMIWDYQIKSNVTNWPIVFKDKIFLFDKGLEVNLDLTTGQATIGDDILHLHISDEYTASIRKSRGEIVEVRHSNGKLVTIESPSLSTKIFHGEFLFDYPYNDHSVICTSLKTGERLWDKKFSDILKAKEVHRGGKEVFADGGYTSICTT